MAVVASESLCLCTTIITYILTTGTRIAFNLRYTAIALSFLSPHTVKVPQGEWGENYLRDIPKPKPPMLGTDVCRAVNPHRQDTLDLPNSRAEMIDMMI